MVQPAYSNSLFGKEDCPFENEIAPSGKKEKVLITGLAQNQRNVLPNAAALAAAGGCMHIRTRNRGAGQVVLQNGVDIQDICRDCFLLFIADVFALYLFKILKFIKSTAHRPVATRDLRLAPLAE